MLNSTLDDIASVIGYTATVKLRTWFAGQCLYVPQVARGDHPLALLIGEPAFRALVKEFAEDRYLRIPAEAELERYERDREIAMRVSSGETVEELSYRFALSFRRIEQIISRLENDGILAFTTARRRRGRPWNAPTLFTENLGTGEVLAEPPSP